jgi:HK97 family phage portal protein
MGSFLRFLMGDAESDRKAPWDDYWYEDVASGGRSTAGMRVTADTALTLSAGWRAVNLLSGDVAGLPLHLYRRTGKGKERLHTPLAQVISVAPNGYQSSFQWREQGMARLLLNGNSYYRIHPGRRGAVDRLQPLHPLRVRPDLVDEDRKRYTYRREDGREERFAGHEILHLMGLSLDGIAGVSAITWGRASLGMAMAAEEFGSRQFTDMPKMTGLLQPEGKLEQKDRDALQRSFREAWGRAGAGGAPVLPHGVKWESVGMTNVDAEYLTTRKFQVTETARWFGVPPHKIGDLEKATFSNIEAEQISYVVHSLLAWLRRIETTINRELVLEDDVFGEFLVDGLLRGDSKSRAEAFAIYLDRGVLNPDEVRDKENMNPRADGRGGEYHRAANLAGKPAQDGASNARTAGSRIGAALERCNGAMKEGAEDPLDRLVMAVERVLA